MDDRTTRLLEALDPVGVELLLELLAESATEASLADSIGATQPTVHRRLRRLANAGLISHEVARPHTPGLRWSINHPEQIDAVLQRIFDLADAIEKAEQTQRENAKRRLTQARAERLGIHEIRPRRS